MHFLYIVILSLISFLYAPKAVCVPSICAHDIVNHVNKIAKQHVLYKEFNQELLKRSYRKFCDYLDPRKIYFLDDEIQKWLVPEEAYLNKALDDFSKERFDTFEEIYMLFQKAVDRHKKILQEEMREAFIVKPIDKEKASSLLTIKNWTKDEDELKNRIRAITGLQIALFSEVKPEMDMQDVQRSIENYEDSRVNPFLVEGQERNIFYTGIIKAIAASFDPHTEFFTEAELRRMTIMMEQRLFGIGAELQENLDGFYIRKVLPGGPAEKSKKIFVGDKIIAVDEQPVAGLFTEDFFDLVRGEKGTYVSLTIERGKERIVVRIQRGEVIFSNTRVQYSVVPFQDGCCIHLSVPTFYQTKAFSTARDIEKILEKVNKENKILGIVLDLRYNVGGVLEEAIAVTGLFIDRGVVASLQIDQGTIMHFRSEEKALWKGPLVVLVNRISASASEIVAQTLQDYQRAIIVGDQHTFGKGSFQMMEETASEQNTTGTSKITMGLYFTPSGKSPQLSGVQSNLVVPGKLFGVEIGEEYLDYPLENKKIAPTFEDAYKDLSFFDWVRDKGLFFIRKQKVIPMFFSQLPLLEKNYMERRKEVDLEKTDEMQLQETCTILKDLIIALQSSSAAGVI